MTIRCARRRQRSKSTSSKEPRRARQLLRPRSRRNAAVHQRTRTPRQGRLQPLLPKSRQQKLRRTAAQRAVLPQTWTCTRARRQPDRSRTARNLRRLAQRPRRANEPFSLWSPSSRLTFRLLSSARRRLQRLGLPRTRRPKFLPHQQVRHRNHQRHLWHRSPVLPALREDVSRKSLRRNRRQVRRRQSPHRRQRPHLRPLRPQSPSATLRLVERLLVARRRPSRSRRRRAVVPRSAASST